MPYIIGVDLTDDVVNNACSLLNKGWIDPIVTDYFATEYPPNILGEPVYVVGHGDVNQGLEHVDLRAINVLDERFKALLADSPQAILVACYLGQDPASAGYQGQTWATSLSQQLGVDVVAATDAVLVNNAAGSLTVDGVNGRWLLFDGAEPYACSDPIGYMGVAAMGNGEGSEVEEPDAAKLKAKRPDAGKWHQPLRDRKAASGKTSTPRRARAT